MSSRPSYKYESVLVGSSLVWCWPSDVWFWYRLHVAEMLTWEFLPWSGLKTQCKKLHWGGTRCVLTLFKQKRQPKQLLTNNQLKDQLCNGNSYSNTNKTLKGSFNQNTNQQTASNDHSLPIYQQDNLQLPTHPTTNDFWFSFLRISLHSFDLKGGV